MRNKELEKERWNALRADAIQRRLPARTDLSFSDRLKYAMLRISIDFDDDGRIEEVLGRSMKQIGRYIESEDLPFSVLAKISKYSLVPLSWLAENQAPFAFRSDADEIDSTFAFIPKFEVSASAGGGALTMNEQVDGVLAFRHDWLRRRGINPEAAAALTARGDSMEPTIRDGDTLLVDTSIDQVMDNGIYVVVIGGLVVVKRVHLSRDGSLTLLSENTVYPAERVPAGEVPDLIFAGRVMWFGRAI
tara:strand:+ start:55116 stop:55856 length:741 start_codon:yes stop_codon:yes gene_type:complete